MIPHRPLRIFLGLLLAATAVAAPVPKAVKTKQNDAELLQGRWEIVTLDLGDGPKPPSAGVRDYHWVFRDEKLYIGEKGNEGPPRFFKLDPTGSPKELDFGRAETAMNPAIYQLDGDTLTICHSLHNNPRPAEFKSSGSVAAACYVLRRVKE